MSSVAVALNAISSTHDGRPPPLVAEGIRNLDCATPSFVRGMRSILRSGSPTMVLELCIGLVATSVVQFPSTHHEARGDERILRIPRRVHDRHRPTPTAHQEAPPIYLLWNASLAGMEDPYSHQTLESTCSLDSGRGGGVLPVVFEERYRETGVY